LIPTAQHGKNISCVSNWE